MVLKYFMYTAYTQCYYKTAITINLNILSLKGTMSTNKMPKINCFKCAEEASITQLRQRNCTNIIENSQWLLLFLVMTVEMRVIICASLLVAPASPKLSRLFFVILNSQWHHFASWQNAAYWFACFQDIGQVTIHGAIPTPFKNSLLLLFVMTVLMRIIIITYS